MNTISFLLFVIGFASGTAAILIAVIDGIAGGYR